MMNKFKVSVTLSPIIEKILHRRMIPYTIENGICMTSLSGERFHKIVLRAKMEKMQIENCSIIPYIAECELNDKTVLQEVGSVYCILK